MKKAKIFFSVFTLALFVMGCGEKGLSEKGRQKLLAKNLMGQMTAICDAKEFYGSQDAFSKAVALLGLTPDQGDPIIDPYLEAELLNSQWVASDALGSRTTAWYGEYGPGEWATLRILRRNGMTEEKQPFDSARSCVLHSPTLTYAEGVELYKAFGLDTDHNGWSMTAVDGKVIYTNLKMKSSGGAGTGLSRDIEFVVPKPNETGVTIIRREYFKKPSSLEQ